jgi:hypothetical protein
VPLVLAVQDSTQADWTAHPKTRGLGQIGTGGGRGMIVHSTLALTPERVPLGLLAQTDWLRPLGAPRSPERRGVPIEHKERWKWLESLAAVKAAHAACPRTRFVSIGDREADIYDLFLVERPMGVDLVVRACKDRCLVDQDGTRRHLSQALAALPVAATVAVDLRRRDQHPARTAQLQVRWGPVTLQPTKRLGGRRPATLPLWTIWAVEETPPPGVAPLDWRLLTTIPLATTEAACTCLEWYTCRWTIEV